MDYGKMDSENTAIKGIKRMIADGVISQEDAEKYCPELKESEDEKIRKELITIISCAADDSSHIYMSKVDSKRYIAWLEKQGEQKPVEWSETDGSFERAMRESKKYTLRKYTLRVV